MTFDELKEESLFRVDCTGRPAVFVKLPVFELKSKDKTKRICNCRCLENDFPQFFHADAVVEPINFGLQPGETVVQSKHHAKKRMPIDSDGQRTENSGDSSEDVCREESADAGRDS